MRFNLRKGLDIFKKTESIYIKIGAKTRQAWHEHLLGRFYLKLVDRSGPLKFSFITKNIGFLLKTIPFADKKSEKHLKNAIEICNEIGCNMVLGPAMFDLGLLQKAKKRNTKAIEYFKQAIEIFRRFNNEGYLDQAEEALNSIQ